MTRTAPPDRRLTERPDLDQLKRQAKELLADFRAGGAEAVAEVKARYHGADAESFSLATAQLVLARSYGFDSWPKLKAFVDGVSTAALCDAVVSGDTVAAKQLLDRRPEIINLERPGHGEMRPLHIAVLARDAEMTRLLMSRGADARIGIYPHRDPTTPLAIATERGYEEIVAIIHDAEERRRGVPLPTPMAPPPVPRELNDAIQCADSGAAIAFLASNRRLAENPDLINRPGQDGLTLLHIAAARLMVDLVTWLLEHGADVHARSDNGFRPVDMLGRWAAGHPHDGLQTVADMLVAHGAERTAFWAVATNDLAWLSARRDDGTLENRVSDGGGLVTFAVRLDRADALTLLLDLGFDPNEGDGKPLDYAVRLGRFALADLLLARGAKLNATTAVGLGKADWLRARRADGTLSHPTEGDGLLTVAVERGRRDILQLLLDLGFDADERKRQVGGDGVYETRGIPLERCVASGEVAMAELLLARGADPNGQTGGGGTPVSTAYRKRDRAMLDLLAKYGGHVSAVTAAYHRDIAIARQRIQQEDAGQLPPGAVTPGRTVAEDLIDGDCGEPEIIRLALERIGWPADDPRWYAVLKGPLSFWNHVPWIESPEWPVGREGYLACFRLILARCHANVCGTFGRTILHDVMTMGFHDGVSGWVSDEEALAFAVTLLNAGARTDVRDALLQSTPLGWACRWGRTPIVKELLNRGVDPVESEAQTWATPRAWAEKGGHREILALLQEHLG